MLVMDIQGGRRGGGRRGGETRSANYLSNSYHSAPQGVECIHAQVGRSVGNGVTLVGGDSDPGDVVAVVAAALASTTRNFNSDDDNSHDDDGDDGNEGLMATKDTPEEESGR